MNLPTPYIPHPSGRGWLAFSVATALIFGCWQVLPRLGVLVNVPPLGLQVACVPGLLGTVLLAMLGRRKDELFRLSAWALATGAAGAFATLCVLLAFARGGQGSVVTPLCSMYPLLTAVLCRLWLGERWSNAQVCGFVLFALAVVAFGGAVSETSGSSFWAPWLGYTMVAFAIFGVSGVTMKLASQDSTVALASWAVGFILTTLAMAAVFQPSLPVSRGAWAAATGYGVLMGAGLWTSFQAYARGPATVVTAVTALYPAITVALAVALPMVAEPFGLRKAVAVLLSLCAGIALCLEPGKAAAHVAVDNRTSVR